jgi:hypothetical protein
VRRLAFAFFFRRNGASGAYGRLCRAGCGRIALEKRPTLPLPGPA